MRYLIAALFLTGVCVPAPLLAADSKGPMDTGDRIDQASAASVQATYNRGVALALSGNNDEAIKAFYDVTRNSGDDALNVKAWYHIGRLHLAKGERSKATRALQLALFNRHALGEFRAPAEHLFQEAQTVDGQQKPEAVGTSPTKSSGQTSGSRAAEDALQRGIELEQAGKIDEAMPYLHQAYQLADTTKAIAAHAYYRLGVIHLNVKRNGFLARFAIMRALQEGLPADMMSAAQRHFEAAEALEREQDSGSQGSQPATPTAGSGGTVASPASPGRRDILNLVGTIWYCSEDTVDVDFDGFLYFDARGSVKVVQTARRRGAENFYFWPRQHPEDPVNAIDSPRIMDIQQRGDHDDRWESNRHAVRFLRQRVMYELRRDGGAGLVGRHYGLEEATVERVRGTTDSLFDMPLGNAFSNITCSPASGWMRR